MKQIEQTISSIEVAEMVSKKHSELLKDIRRYSGQLNEVKIPSVDFFIESTYKDNKGETRPCYDITKKGCEFIAHKLTGIKGTEFTARYINRFNDMEDIIRVSIPKNQTKADRTKIMEMNARSRMAQTYIKLAQVDTLSKEYKNILVSKASEVLSGVQLIPLPETKRKVYSAGEIGDMFGVSGNKIGRIANKYNLKVKEYGEYRRSKSEYSTKELDTWVYFDTVYIIVKNTKYKTTCFCCIGV